MEPQHIKAIVFDADDTLWDCQSHFEVVENQLYDLLQPWCNREQAAHELFLTEHANMAALGYGSKAFTLSILQTALRVSRREMPQHHIEELLMAGERLSQLPGTPLAGVRETLQTLRHRWLPQQEGRQLVVFTKGELLEQEYKLNRSGLLPLFDHSVILSNKDEQAYLQLCNQLGIKPSEMLAVGNSFKSDIAPALHIGASAIHIPFHVVWQLERSEEFDHERMVKIACFQEILAAKFVGFNDFQ